MTCLGATPNAALVTGAAGFIGSKLVEALQLGGMRVAGIVARGGSSALERFREIDIAGPVTDEFFERDSVVFHLAGKVHSLAEIKQDDAEYFRINTQGTKNVLEAAQRAGVKRFVFFSTIKAMSRDGNGGWRMEDGGARAFTEEDDVEPDTAYGKSKREAEELVLHGGYVPEPVVLRLCMVYGPSAKGNMQKMLHAIAKHRFPALPEVNNKRSMLHVDDAVKAAILVAHRTEAVGQTFIVSDGCSYSTRKIYALMCQALGRRPAGWSIPIPCLRALGLVGDAIGKVRGKRFLFDSDALQKLIGSAWFSSKKIETLLGFKPEWNLEKAMPDMIVEMGIPRPSVISPVPSMARGQ